MSNILREWPRTDGKILVNARILFGKEDRILYLKAHISDTTMDPSPDGPLVSSDDICDDLILLDRESSEPIKLVINSPGGIVDGGFNILDTITGLRSPLWTLVRSSGSFGSIIAIFGAKGHRYMLPSSILHLHGATMVIAGKQSDVESIMEKVNIFKNWMLDLLIEKTELVKKVKQIEAEISAIMNNSNGEEHEGKKKTKPSQREAEREAVMHWLDTERFFTAKEAIKMGLVDHIVTPEFQREFFNVPK